MLKVLLILAFLLNVFGVQADSGANKAKQGQKSQRPAADTSAIPPQQPDSQSLQSEPPKQTPYEVRVISTPQKDGYDRAALWVNVALAVAGIFGIVIAICTLIKIERQTKAAELNMKAMVNAERAWIVVSVEAFVPGEFRFWATNEGKTPANVVSIWSCNIPLKRGDKLATPPDDQTDESLLQSPPCLIPPGAKTVVWQCTAGGFHKQFGGNPANGQSLFARGLLSAYMFGRIRYFDVLDENAKVAHETRWLYWLMPFENAVPFPDPMHREHNNYT
jgi:hypothetical protein